MYEEKKLNGYYTPPPPFADILGNFNFLSSGEHVLTTGEKSFTSICHLHIPISQVLGLACISTTSPRTSITIAVFMLENIFIAIFFH